MSHIVKMSNIICLEFEYFASIFSIEIDSGRLRVRYEEKSGSTVIRKSISKPISFDISRKDYLYHILNIEIPRPIGLIR